MVVEEIRADGRTDGLPLSFFFFRIFSYLGSIEAKWRGGALLHASSLFSEFLGPGSRGRSPFFSLFFCFPSPRATVFSTREMLRWNEAIASHSRSLSLSSSLLTSFFHLPPKVNFALHACALFLVKKSFHRGEFKHLGLDVFQLGTGKAHAKAFLVQGCVQGNHATQTSPFVKWVC